MGQLQSQRTCGWLQSVWHACVPQQCCLQIAWRLARHLHCSVTCNVTLMQRRQAAGADGRSTLTRPVQVHPPSDTTSKVPAYRAYTCPHP